MSLAFEFELPLRNGVHARPAGGLARRAKAYRSRIELQNSRNGHSSNVKSILSLVAADFRYGDRCVLTVHGTDQAEAYMRLREFLKTEFADFDAPAAEPKREMNNRRLPPSLERCHPTFLRGEAIVEGIAAGTIHILNEVQLNTAVLEETAQSIPSELQRLDDAVRRVRREIANLMANRPSRVEEEILSTHLSIAEDPEFRRHIERHISTGGSAAQAIHAAIQHYEAALHAHDNPILRDRLLDLQDVNRRLLLALHGDTAISSIRSELTQPSICAAASLTPQDLIALNREHIKGLVLGSAGSTSHTVILARSLGIPLVGGVSVNQIQPHGGKQAVLDADHGILVLEPSRSVRRYYALEQEKATKIRTQRQQCADRATRTTDGHAVTVRANILTPGEIEIANREGADGVGLLRSEWLFLNRAASPSEQEQFDHYRAIVEASENRAVVIRLLDVGGDKRLDYLDLRKEENPFLGYRGVRIYREFETIIRQQIRAILRASAYGTVWMLIPMVSVIDEVLWVRRLVAELRQELDAEEVSYAKEMPIGVMIEVPSAAFMIDQFACVSDFFSIGSNDLIQYLLAADRSDGRVSGLQSPCNPAFLRLLAKIIREANAAERRVCLCGELAGNEEFLPLLLGAGLRELSVTPPSVVTIKAAIGDLNMTDCEALLERALSSTSSEETSQLVQCFKRDRRQHPIISDDLVVLDSEAESREEVIKELADNLQICGRTQKAVAIEEAVWEREKLSSTSVGYGIAIPHCSSEHVLASAVSILRLKNPIKWDEEQGDSVSTVFMLSINSEEQSQYHMKILSQLARRIMQPEFRDELQRRTDRQSLVEYISSQIELQQN